MFERRDSQVYRGVDRKDIYPKVCEWWARQGFYVSQVGAYYIHGTSYHTKIGLRREFQLYITERDDAVSFDLTFRAQITDEGIVGGGVAAIVFWPAALVGGALSYEEYEKEAKSTMGAFWQFIDQDTKVEGVKGEPEEPAPEIKKLPAPETGPCEVCGALLPTEWKACPYCGNPL